MNLKTNKLPRKFLVVIVSLLAILSLTVIAAGPAPAVSSIHKFQGGDGPGSDNSMAAQLRQLNRRALSQASNIQQAVSRLDGLSTPAVLNNLGLGTQQEQAANQANNQNQGNNSQLNNQGQGNNQQFTQSQINRQRRFLAALQSYKASLAQAQRASAIAQSMIVIHAGFDADGNVTDRAVAKNTIKTIEENLRMAAYWLKQANKQYDLAKSASQQQ